MTPSPRTTVFFDGGCPACMRGVRHYRRLDWARRVDWVDLLGEPDALEPHGVSFAGAMEHMHAMDRRGRLRSGAWAFAALWAELPGYRHLAALLSAAGLLPFMDRRYRRFTRGRFARRCADGACGTGGASRAPTRLQDGAGLSGTFGAEAVSPGERERRMRAMFGRIAGRYDLMNDLMSLGVHRLWKRRLAWAADPRAGQVLVDLAGGTGDVARLLRGSDREVLVCDPVLEMMGRGRARAGARVTWVAAAGETLPLADARVDTLVVAFGLRNMTSLEAALGEVLRVLVPGGRFLCLEFSRPHALVRPVYGAFSRTVIPLLGGAVAGDPEAYRYLVESIRRFPPQEVLSGIIEGAGFENVRYKNLSLGIGCIHLARKPGARRSTAGLE